MSEAAVPGGVRSRLGRVSLLSDDRLAERAVKGDERAFAAIFGRYHQDLYRYCMAIVGNPTDAQDALQNTMVKVLRALPGEERQIELKPWLYRIAHNEAIELLRRRRPTEELDPELLSQGNGLAEDAAQRERLRGLLTDLDQLPDRQRGALVMRELAGLGFAEIAASLGTSEGVARQTLYEARLSLRQMDKGREMTCDAVARALSDADGRVTRRRDIRAHLRACADCRRFRDEVAARRQDFAGLAPLPAIAAAGLLQGVLGGAAGGSAASGAGLAGAVGGGAAQSLGTAAGVKSAAAVLAVAAVGVGVADRGGVVDATPWDGGGSQPAQQDQTRGDVQSGPPSQGPPADQGSAPGAGQEAAGSADVGSAVDTDPRGASSGRADPSQGSGAADGAPAGTAGGGAGGTHPHGRGHEKQHPDAASHGQQTAAGHKAEGKGAGGERGASGSKPSKPVKPPKQAQPKPSKQQPSQSAGGGGGKANAAPKAPAVPEVVTPPTPPPSAQAAEQAPPAVPAPAGK